MEPDHVAGQRGRCRYVRQCGGVEGTQLAMRAEQRGHRRRVVFDHREHARILREHGSPGRSDDGSDRGPARAEQVGGQPLGQAIDRGDEEPGHARMFVGEPCRQMAASDDTGVVVGHQHGDRRHRVVLLQLRDLGA